MPNPNINKNTYGETPELGGVDLGRVDVDRLEEPRHEPAAREEDDDQVRLAPGALHHGEGGGGEEEGHDGQGLLPADRVDEGEGEEGAGELGEGGLDQLHVVLVEEAAEGGELTLLESCV